MTTFPYAPDNAIHPGELLAEELQERRWTQADLCRLTGLTAKHVCRVINGKAAVGPHMALLLERELGASALMWMRLQAAWDLAQARQGSAGDRAALLARLTQPPAEGS